MKCQLRASWARGHVSLLCPPIINHYGYFLSTIRTVSWAQAFEPPGVIKKGRFRSKRAPLLMGGTTLPLWLGTEVGSGGGPAERCPAELSGSFLIPAPSASAVLPDGWKWCQFLLVLCAKFKSTTGSRLVVSSLLQGYLGGSGKVRTNVPQRSFFLPPPPTPTEGTRKIGRV